MSFSVHDGITPELARKARRIADKKPILEAMGLQLVSITKRSFSDASLRPKAWPPRKSGGTHSLLRKSGSLWQSIRITQTTGESVTVGSDRVYAAIQQFGSRKQKGRGSGIPARPFFPFASPDAPMSENAQEKIRK